VNSYSPQDLAQREKALDITRSCCVQAPAGSGKTELLTQRILKLLAACQRPEEILAITFTRKAAAEMRNRLLENLSEAKRLSDADIAAQEDHKQTTLKLARAVLDRDATLNWSLLDNTSRLRINTIDSFNQFLVSQLPVTSALGMLPTITEKPREIFREAVRDTLKELDRESQLGEELEVLLGHMNNQWAALENLFCNLLFRRDQWLSYILEIRQDPSRTRQLMEQTLIDIVESALSELDDALSPYLPRILPTLQFAAENLALDGSSALLGDWDFHDALPENTAGCLNQWRGLVTLLVTDKPALRKTVVAAQGFPAQTAPGSKEDKTLRKQHKDNMIALLKEMAHDPLLVTRLETFHFLPDSMFEDNQWRVLESLTTILPQLVSRLNMVFARHQLSDYPHISAAALEALGDEEQPTDLALRLDYHLKHILVDEFQDTSTMQVSLLKKLTHGWEVGDDRTLFIVGDGMQSCYGFRNARVGLFLAARDNGIGNIRFDDLRLTSNFRSEAAVVSWVNDVFQGAFPAKDDISRGGVSYNPAEAVNENSAAAGIRTCLFSADKDLALNKERQRYAEALKVAETIISIQRDFPEESIAVLVRSRNQLQGIIPVLRECNLQWNAAEIDPLLTYPVIRDLLSLTRSMLNPADTIAWLALLRTPMFGLRLTDIHCLARHKQECALQEPCSLWQSLQHYSTVAELSVEAHDILGRVMPVLQLAREQRQRLPLRDWIENLWVLLGGPISIDQDNLADNLEQFFTLLEEHDSGGDIEDIHLFENEVSAMYGSGQHPDANLHIMTIHKAKGLEFHHVIVPGLDRLTGSNDNPLLQWKEHITGKGEERLVLSLPAQKGRDRDKDSIYRYLKYELELEQRMETTRLLYVAVTRAIKQALLLGSVILDGDDLKPPAKKSLLATIWPQLLERMDVGDIEVVQIDDESVLPPELQPRALLTEESNQILSRRLPPAWRSSIELRAEDISAEISGTNEKITSHQHMLEKQVGEIIHYCLMLIAQGNLDFSDANQLKKLEAVWRSKVESLTDKPEFVIGEIHQQLNACRQHEQFAWMVLDVHVDQGSELSLSDFTGGSRQEYIIDRTFRDAEGQRWIIDYKSSRPAEKESLEFFLDRQVEQYRGQLTAYARLFTEMEQIPVRTALFFTAIPCFKEISLDSPS
jgi:ATP-dependent helicase/nuclease subunit A